MSPEDNTLEMKAKKIKPAMGSTHSIDFYMKFAFMLQGWKNDPINNESGTQMWGGNQ